MVGLKDLVKVGLLVFVGECVVGALVGGPVRIELGVAEFSFKLGDKVVEMDLLGLIVAVGGLVWPMLGLVEIGIADGNPV